MWPLGSRSIGPWIYFWFCSCVRVRVKRLEEMLYLCLFGLHTTCQEIATIVPKQRRLLFQHSKRKNIPSSAAAAPEVESAQSCCYVTSEYAHVFFSIVYTHKRCWSLKWWQPYAPRMTQTVCREQDKYIGLIDFISVFFAFENLCDLMEAVNLWLTEESRKRPQWAHFLRTSLGNQVWDVSGLE